MAARPRIDDLQLISKLTLLPQLDQSERQALLAIATRRQFPARHTIVRKGDLGSQFFGILSGRLKAVTTSADGRDLALSIMGPGEMCGEIALLDEAERSATMVSIEPCELLCIDRQPFLDFLEQNPRVAIKMLSALASRVRTLTALVEDTLFLNLPARLSKKLLDLASIYGRKTPDGVRIDLKLSQQELGDLVGTTRESINKQIRIWTSEGVLTWHHGQVTLRRMDVLESLAGMFLL